MWNRGRIWLVVILSLVLLVGDVVSKRAIHENVPVITLATLNYPYGGVGIFKDFLGVEFSIVHVTNTGAAWNLFADSQLPLLLARIAVILGLITYLFFFNRRFDAQIPLVLVIAGAISNVLDVFLYGHVVDMLHFRFWGYEYPVFNLADSAISVGVAWLFLMAFVGRREASIL